MYSDVERASQTRRREGREFGPLAAAFVLLLLLGGCAYLTPEPSNAAVVPTATRSPEPTPSNTPQPLPTRVDPNAPITLTLWLPPEMILSEEESPGSPIVRAWNAHYLAAHSRVRLNLVPKAAYGPGGIVSMVLATQPVVPARLPDVIVFDTAELPRLAEAGVLQPLDDALPASLWQGMYPFAVDAVTLDGQRLGVPYHADVDVLAYDRDMVPEPPETWDALLTMRQEDEQPPTLIFPATGSDGSAADAFMVHYLALGGRLTEENGRPFLDSGIAARILRSYRSAMDAGIVPEAVRRLRTREDCWGAFLDGGASLAGTTARLYHQDQALAAGIGYAPLPTMGTEMATVARSWAWGVTTSDPTKRDLAVEYITTALEAERVAAWGTATGYVPTQREVLPAVIEDAPYRRFLGDQMEQARPYPRLKDYGAIQAAVVRAIEDVLDGLATPERAAITAAASVMRLR